MLSSASYYGKRASDGTPRTCKQCRQDKPWAKQTNAPRTSDRLRCIRSRTRAGECTQANTTANIVAASKRLRHKHPTTKHRRASRFKCGHQCGTPKTDSDGGVKDIQVEQRPIVTSTEIGTLAGVSGLSSTIRLHHLTT